MKVVYKKPIVERLMDAIQQAHKEYKTIDYVEFDAEDTNEFMEYLYKNGIMSYLKQPIDKFLGVNIKYT